MREFQKFHRNPEEIFIYKAEKSCEKHTQDANQEAQPGYGKRNF